MTIKTFNVQTLVASSFLVHANVFRSLHGKVFLKTLGDRNNAEK